MADDAPAAATAPSASHTSQGRAFSSALSGSSPNAAPPGHTFRRAVTVDEASPFRRRPPLNQSGTEDSFEPPRRRSSTFSDYSLNEARRSLQSSTDEILNPGAKGMQHHESSGWASLPLAFALLPAVGGILFKNGSAVITDVMLLSLAAIFLRWSVTQPWIWYHSAQEVRVQEELRYDVAVEDESEAEGVDHPPPPLPPTKATILDNVPELPEEGEAIPAAEPPAKRARARPREEAFRELFIHEVLALISCFVSPMLGAYLLHVIRAQLSRPSEGLVSNYNLTIFLLASEIRPLSHLIKLVQARTLHLQRMVHADPFKEQSQLSAQIEDMARRLQELESRTASEDPSSPTQNGPGDASSRTKNHEASVVREVRNAIQPELDALNRAVRRYEKKATVLAFQTESRLSAIDTRLDDAISLAAVAAKNSASQWSFLGWVVDSLVWMVILPFQALSGLLSVAFRPVSALLGWNKRPAQERSQRGGRSGKGGGSQPRLGSSDRTPARASKR